MIAASKLAGFFAAHAIWSVSDGEPLTSMFARTTADDDRHMEQLIADDLAESVAIEKEKLESNEVNGGTVPIR
jgi:hypothetical protein